jgi:hypothetical protein
MYKHNFGNNGTNKIDRAKDFGKKEYKYRFMGQRLTFWGKQAAVLLAVLFRA